MAKLFTPEAILHPVVGIEPFELPVKDEKGNPYVVFIRPISAGSVVDFINNGSVMVNPDGTVTLTDPAKQSNAMMQLMMANCCDEHGDPIYTDINHVKSMPMSVYQAIQQRLSESITEGTEKGKDSEAPALTVVPSPIDASPTVSPSTSDSST